MGGTIGNNGRADDTRMVALATGNVGDSPTPVGGSNSLPVSSPDGFLTVSGSFTRPADTSAYAAGDRVANATTGAVVFELTGVGRTGTQSVRIERARLRKSTKSLANAQFRVHLFRTLPTVGVDDNGVFNTSGALAVSDISGYIGSIDVTIDKSGSSSGAGAIGIGAPTTGSGITADMAATAGHETSLWIVIEALAAYTPGNAEVFTLTLEMARA